MDTTCTSKVRTCIFPVAGLGSRALPGSISVPKHFHFVAGYPIIQYAVSEAKQAGIEKFIFVTGSQPFEKELLKKQFIELEEIIAALQEKNQTDLCNLFKTFSLRDEDVIFVEQPSPTGLGGAVLSASEYVKSEEQVAIVCPDDLILPIQHGLPKMMKDIMPDYSYVGLQKVLSHQYSKYGIVKNHQEMILDVVEKPAVSAAPSNLAISGRYILTKDVIDILEYNMTQYLNSSHNYFEVGLTEALRTYARSGHLRGIIIDGKRLDCGDRIGLIEANIYAISIDNDLKALLR